MSPRLTAAAILLACALAPSVASARVADPGPGLPSPRGEGVVEGRYIVVYEAGVADPAAATDRRERARGFRARFVYRRALKGFAARLSPAQVAALRADPEVAYVAPDRAVRARGVVPLAGGEPLPPAGVRRIQGATSTTTREAADAAVAVIDTGIDLGHPDLDAAHGANCVTPGQPAQDDDGHGTHVAGTIGARNNGSGVVGVAPGTRLYAVKVLDANGEGTWSQVICGIDWVTANAGALGIDVANMSLGGPGSNDNACGTLDDDPLHQAFCRATGAGVSMVVAAGNDGWDIGDNPPDVPSTYPEALTVTAMSDSDGRGGALGGAPACRAGETDDAHATFSNYATRAGDEAHMIAAPGVCIRSTALGGGTAVMSGTSMAAPHVAGAVALCLGEAGVAGPCAGRTPAQIVERLRADAEAQARTDATYGFAGDPLRPNRFGDYFGYLARAVPDTAPPETRLTGGPSGWLRSTSASFTFSATQAGSRFECRLDGAAWQACTSPEGHSGLGEGPHTFEVRAIDAAGNADATPASSSFTVDTVAPDTSFASGPQGLVNDDTPTFGLAATEPGARFECRVDADAWAACASPYTTRQLADGAHTVQARAVDPAGNVDATAASRSITVDATAPSTTLTSGPGAVTKNTTPTFEFTSDDPGASFQCRVDEAAWAACTSPHRTAQLALGSHTFEVRARDAAGNLDATPARHAFRVDPEAVAALPPRARSDAASAVGQTGATLHGAIDPQGQTTRYRFEWGTTTAYGAATPEQTLAADAPETVVSATLFGLTPGTTYHYRLVATSAGGTTAAADRTFTTAPATVASSPAPSAPAPAPAPSEPVPDSAGAPAPPAPVPAPAPAAADRTAPTGALILATQRLATVLRRGLAVTLRSSEAGTAEAALLLDGRTARRLGLSRGRAVTAGRTRATLAAAGTRRLTVRLTRAARVRLRRVRRVTLTLRVAVRDGAGNAATLSRRVTLAR
jgi:subtilisin